jgi:thymidylate kinase
VVDRLTAGPRVLAEKASAAALTRRVRIGDRWSLDVDDEFWHLMLHAALRPVPRATRPPRPSGWSEVTDAAHPAGPMAEAVKEMAGYGDGDLRALLERARQDPEAAIDALRARLRERARSAVTLLADRSGRESARESAQGSAKALATRAAALLGSLTHPSGLSVAILGPDGAGKTTLAENLRRALPLPTRYVYLGVWREYPWDRWLRYLVGARLLLRLLRLSYRSMQVRWHRARGRVVLLDRFTYDALLPSDYLDRRGKITTALVRRLGAQPDLLLVLDAPAEVMFARKGEQTIEELDRRRRTYREVGAQHPAAAVLDAARPAADVLAEAQQAVWAALAQRWRRSLPL